MSPTDTSLSLEQYKEVKKMICPYCDQGLPDYLAVGDGFIHTIPDDPSSTKFHCLATRFRRKVKGPNSND